MILVPQAKDPARLSYLALRKGVGFIAFLLPFAVAIPIWLLRDHLEPSISDYYYTGTRNLLVGSLCAIGMFQLACRGYDRKDEIAGIFSAICAIGVALFPTPPEGATPFQKHVGWAHYTFAALLFFTLAYFCLVLFKMSAKDRVITDRKIQRNHFYSGCGIAILASIGLLALLKLGLGKDYLGPVGTTFVFETTSLWAFGLAWMIKGETLLEDKAPPPSAKP